MVPRGIETDVLTVVGLAVAVATELSLQLLQQGRLVLNWVHKQWLEQVSALEGAPVWRLGSELQLRAPTGRGWQGGDQRICHRLR